MRSLALVAQVAQSWLPSPGVLASRALAEDGDGDAAAATDPEALDPTEPEASVVPVAALAARPSSTPQPRSAAAATRLANVSDIYEVDEVVRRAQRGDRAAFSELFRRHKGDVSRLVFRMLGPTPDAEDVVQEVFLQVHRSLVEFRGQAKFTTWLHRVTVNVVLMVRRAAKSRPVFAGEPVADHEPDRGMQPDEGVARQNRINAFRRLLDRLPEKKRTVFILHEIEGMSPAEISDLVDAPVLTVRTRLFYARREIADMMKEEPSLVQLAGELARERTAEGSKAEEAEAT